MRSVRFRLIAWSALLLTAGFALSFGIVYWRLARSLYDWVDPALVSRASEVEDGLAVRGGRVDVLPQTEEPDQGSDAGEAVQAMYARLWTADFRTTRTLDPSPSLPAAARVRPFLSRVIGAKQVRFTLQRRTGSGTPRQPSRDAGAGGPTRILLVRLPATGRPAGVLEIGMSVSGLTATLQRLRDLMLVVVPVVLALLIAGSRWLIALSLRPLNRLGRSAASIRMGNLGQGLEVPQTGDEVERLARLLNEMLQRLDDSFQRERRFTADASHELRTPLAIMQSEIEVALRERAAPSREVLRDLAQEVDRMRALVQALLELSRSDAGEMKLELEKVELNGLVEAVVEQSEVLARSAGVDLSFSRGDRALVLGDEARLIQVFLNLIDNAIRYTPRGGAVSVWVDLLDASREASGERPGERTEARCTIRNTGSGIAPEQLPHVFERFYRGDASRSSRGAGLGLSIAQAIARAHGGRIEIDSAPGQGVCARVYLPMGRG